MSAERATAYADLAVLTASLGEARAGQSFIYAAGASLDQGQAVVQLVSRLRGEGRVRTNIAGRDLDGRLRYQVTVLPRADDAAPAPEPLLHRHDAALLGLLEELAEARAACPSLKELARRLKLRTRHDAGYRLRRLEKLGLIRVVKPRDDLRIVTICSSGLKTGESK